MGKPFGNFKFNIGDLITTEERNLLIIDREYRDFYVRSVDYTQHRKYYKYHCNICEYEDWIIENSLLPGKYGYGCSYCGGINKLFKGRNDVATVMPEIAKLFKDKNEASNNTCYTKKSSNICMSRLWQRICEKHCIRL